MATRARIIRAVRQIAPILFDDYLPRMSQWVKNVTEGTFEAEVVEASRRVPVVVDFWAPWCGPCRTLGPLLDRLAEENEGAFIVAKINVDENPHISAEFGIRSIPAVKAIADGEIVDEFVGVLPEPALRQFVRRLLPSEADRLAESARAAEDKGNTAAAESLYREALEQDPNHPQARLGVGRLLASSNGEAALQELDRVLPGTPEREEADRVAARLRLAGENGGGVAELRARVEANPADLEARLDLARALAAAEDYEAALGHLLEVVKRDRGYGDEAGRKSMLDIFNVLGARHPISERYRGELARILYS
ncbi:MAG: tetratricopeptide repeat protein [Candidatus Binatia bacterium]